MFQWPWLDDPGMFQICYKSKIFGPILMWPKQMDWTIFEIYMMVGIQSPGAAKPHTVHVIGNTKVTTFRVVVFVCLSSFVLITTQKAFSIQRLPNTLKHYLLTIHTHRSAGTARKKLGHVTCPFHTQINKSKMTKRCYLPFAVEVDNHYLLISFFYCCQCWYRDTA